MHKSLAFTDGINDERIGRGLEPIRYGIGLNLGSVMYGNIGVPERLAFSAIGPTVIEVARIEKLTKTVGSRVLATARGGGGGAEALALDGVASPGGRGTGRRSCSGSARKRRSRPHERVSSGFRYEDLPVFDAFEKVSDPSIFTPLPDDWQVGAADVVKSTDALRAGRYKDVNMAGAAVVGAVRNALGGKSFPFVFGGDGAVLAVPGEAVEAARGAMSATANFVADELKLMLRVGMLPVAKIRASRP